MIEETVWTGLEEEIPFKQKIMDIKEWGLNNVFHLHDLQSWFDVEENFSCTDSTRLVDVSKKVSLHSVKNDGTSKNKKAFADFVKTNLNNPEYADKYVVFIDGCFQKSGVDKITLAKEMYDEFGNVEMYINKISSPKTMIVIDTPEFV